MMFRTEQLLGQVVDRKIEEIFSRPEVQKELSDSIELHIHNEITNETKNFVANYVRNHNSALINAIRDGINQWIEVHKDEVQALADQAAQKAATDETVYNTIAKEQFHYTIGRMAGQAIDKALASRAKKAAKAAKAAK